METIPAHAKENLKGHARPTGNTSDWPLDEPRLEQFEKTVELRNSISSAASLYQALLVISAILLAITAPVVLYAMQDLKRGLSVSDDILAIGPLVGVTGGFTVLYYFVYRATVRSRRWAPMTMLIIFIFCALIVGTAMVFMAIYPKDSQAAALIGGFVLAVIDLAFIFLSARACLAIPKYLAQPAWCQELIVKAGL
jgi:hypothetical protein